MVLSADATPTSTIPPSSPGRVGQNSDLKDPIVQDDDVETVIYTDAGDDSFASGTFCPEGRESQKRLLRFKTKQRQMPKLVTIVDPDYARRLRKEKCLRVLMILFAFLLSAILLSIILVPIEMASRKRAANDSSQSTGDSSVRATDPLPLMKSPKLADLDWWKKSPIYQIYPRSFKDSNGDGVGDVRGIIEKLDYLHKIGIRSVWLSPIFESPMADFGYDVSDFRAIDPIFGTMADFKELIDKMHERDMYLILDFIPNHTSNLHNWFLESSKNKANKYADYYVWKDGSKSKPPNNWVSVFGGPAWTWSVSRQQWYLHQFLPEQPDLDFRNDAVWKEMEDVLTFWMDLGVDGFRVDAINHLIEDSRFRNEAKNSTRPKTMKANERAYWKHDYTIDQPETYEVVHSWTKLLGDYSKKHNRKVFMMTEAYTTMENKMRYYDAGVDFPFNFDLIVFNKETKSEELRAKVGAWMKNISANQTRWPNWVLSNHDNSRATSRLGGRMYADVLNMLLLLLPGTPTVYYGEEIGMTDIEVTFEDTRDPFGKRFGRADYRKHSRDPERSPMQWSKGVFGGFSSAKPWLPLAPDFETNNVDAQFADPTSNLTIFMKLVELRKGEVFSEHSNNIRLIDMKDDNLFCFQRFHPTKANESSFVVLLNFGNNDETSSLGQLQQYARGRVTVILASGSLKLKVGDEVDLSRQTLTDGQGLVLRALSPESQSVAQDGEPSSKRRKN